MDFVIFDSEYTTWDGAMTRKWRGAGEHKEIIQIGALKVSFPAFEIVDKLSLIIKPTVNPQLSDYCTKLTGITQKQVDAGVDFAAGLRQFCAFCGDCLVGSYGNDICVMAENAELLRTDPQNIYGLNVINLRFWIGRWNHKALTMNSGSLWQLLENNCAMDHTREHDALDDCYSLWDVLHYMHQQGADLPFVK